MTSRALDLIGRLRARIPTHDDPNACRLWNGGCSRSGRREVDYPILRHGRPHPMRWRVNRLVLILKTAPIDVPRDDEESTED